MFIVSRVDVYVCLSLPANTEVCVNPTLTQVRFDFARPPPPPLPAESSWRIAWVSNLLMMNIENIYDFHSIKLSGEESVVD